MGVLYLVHLGPVYLGPRLGLGLGLGLDFKVLTKVLTLTLILIFFGRSLHSSSS